MSQVAELTTETLFREMFPKSAKLAERGRDIFPSGVTHDGRYLSPFPIYVERAKGSRKTTVEGKELIDYWMGHGAMLLGHSHPALIEAVQNQIAKGTHYGACHEAELVWGEWVKRLVPSAEKVRFTSSGTEATLMALRIARLVSGKSKVLKFAGHFHGWHDQLIPGASPPHDGSGRYATPGVTDSVLGDLVVVPPNDLNAVAEAIDVHDPACVIVESTGGRWGVAPLDDGFLTGLRELTAAKNVIYIVDEVISGFRVHPGGVQGQLGFKADLTTLAKVLAGGLPGGCVAGRADLMEAIAFNNPLGKKMKHPGTFNANPLSAVAGAAALEIVSTGEPCEKATLAAVNLREKLNELFVREGVSWAAYGVESLTKIHPEYDGPPPQGGHFRPFENQFAKLDREFDLQLQYAFRCALAVGGVDWMGWGGMTSAAHTEADIDQTVTAFADAIKLLRADGLIA